MKPKLLFIMATVLLLFAFFYVNYQSEARAKDRKYYEERDLIVWDIETDQKIIALTFDDGPHPTNTSKLLDVLAKYDAKATFFIVGEQAEKYPDIVRRQFEEGHELANHTFTHTYNASVQQLEGELQKTSTLLQEITGLTPKLFRPVGGSYNEEIIDMAASKGYRVIMWSWHQDSEDWKRPGVEKIIQKVLKQPTRGDVVLFHDGGGNRDQTVVALDKIIPTLQEQGYTFVTISEMIDIRDERNIEINK